MRDYERDRLRDVLTRQLRRDGMLEADAPLPDDAMDRWGRLVINEAWTTSNSWDVIADDMLSWWRSMPLPIREYVLAGQMAQSPAAPPPQANTPRPNWWPAYEQYVSDLVRPLVKAWLLETPSLDSDALSSRLEPILGFRPFPFPSMNDYMARIDDPDSRFGFSPVSVGWDKSGIVPSVVIRVRTPFIDSRAITDEYEYWADHLRQDVEKPPTVAVDSVRFYQAYEAQVRSGVRSKVARLKALPDDLRGKRSPNSAAAYHGKLKKSFLKSFDGITARWPLHQALKLLRRDEQEAHNA